MRDAAMDAGRVSRRRIARGLLFPAALVAAMAAGCARQAAVRPALIPEDYASWRTSVDHILDYPIPGHEDNARLIRMNDAAYRAAAGAEAGRVVFPVGSVIVKEVYAGLRPAPGQGPAKLTAMVKAPTDPEARNGWLWVVKDLSTGEESVITGDFCATCHAAANESHPYGDGNPREEFRDSVFMFPGESPDGASTDAPGEAAYP